MKLKDYQVQPAPYGGGELIHLVCSQQALYFEGEHPLSVLVAAARLHEIRDCEEVERA